VVHSAFYNPGTPQFNVATNRTLLQYWLLVTDITLVLIFMSHLEFTQPGKLPTLHTQKQILLPSITNYVQIDAYILAVAPNKACLNEQTICSW